MSTIREKEWRSRGYNDASMGYARETFSRYPDRFMGRLKNNRSYYEYGWQKYWDDIEWDHPTEY